MSSSDPEHDGGPDAEHPSSPEPDPLDVDNAFAAIIAGWADAPATGTWPAEEDLASGRHRRTDDPVDASGKSRSEQDDDPYDDSLARAGGPLIPSLGDQQSEPPDDDSGAFVPPDPPPLPRGDLVTRLAWAGVLGGPLFLVTAVIVWRSSAPPALVLSAVAGFVGGFVVLVSRMPKHRSDDDDDGAVL
jgi:hypothetical protein